MKKKILIGLLIFMILTIASFLFFFRSYNNTKKSFQNDADLIRLEHLEYWTGLVEEYHDKIGHYPFQNNLQKNEIVTVKILTKNQQKIKQFSIGGPNFKEIEMKDFVLELENKLGKKIEEKYDVQKIPTNSPVGYNYFVSEDGYLVWVTCKTCGITPISTLLMDGVTPTVNIVSEGMLKNVTKSLKRESMLNHPIYKKWKTQKFEKEDYVRLLEEGNFNDSKK